MANEKNGGGLFKELDVLVCTGGLSFRGTLRCEFSQRLIDALNEGVKANGDLRAVGFLPLQDVTMFAAQGGEQRFKRLYVSLQNIVFVAQASGGSDEKPLSTYPFREKLPARVLAYVERASDAHFTVEGRIYVDTWGQVADTIETGARFIPFTEVEVYPAPAGGGTSYSFVALNKERIISVSESP